MKKKFLAVVSGLVMAVTSLISCGGGSGAGFVPNENSEDKDKVVLSVQNYYGGYGDEWLRQVIAQFEKDYADFELDGKKGVVVKIKNTKEFGDDLLDAIQGSSEEVFFTEGTNYYNYVGSEKFANITDLVTTPLTEHGETKTIEDKMSADVKNFFNVDGKYYAIPFTEAYYGVQYDIDMFKRYKFYLKGDQNGRAYQEDGKYVFAILNTDVKSYGPNGKTGVIDGVDYSVDDGLPATYEEFYALCAKMKSNNPSITPFLWSGFSGYAEMLLTSLYADYEGVDNIKLNFSISGTADNIVDRIEDGMAVLKSVDIKPNNGATLYKQAGRYYALEFLYNIITNGYVSSLSFSPSESHTMAQSDFIYGSYKEVQNKERIAMLVEGSWWNNEAKDVFTSMATLRGDEALQQNRNFGYMPLPKVSKDQIGEDQTRLLQNDTAIFINGNIQSNEKLQLCKDFVRYVCSDKWLINFNVTTNSSLLYNYELSDADYNKLSTYGKSLYAFRSSNNLVYPKSKAPIYLSNPTYFSANHDFWKSTIPNGTYNSPVDLFKDNTCSFVDYFNGIYTFRDSAWERQFSSFFED